MLRVPRIALVAGRARGIHMEAARIAMPSSSSRRGLQLRLTAAWRVPQPRRPRADYRVMVCKLRLSGFSAIRQALADPATMVGSSAALTGGAEAPSASTAARTGSESSFAAELQQASAGYEAPSGQSAPPGSATAATLLDGAGTSTLAGPTGAVGAGSSYPLQGLDGVAGSSALAPADTAYQDSSPGARIVAIAESQLGQTEQPPGSNKSRRSPSTAARPPAPCPARRGARIASWVARQAGAPIGEMGQGAGAVADVWSWAQSSGRAIANGPGVVPKPGDLIVFGDEHVGIVRGVLPSGQIQTIEGGPTENKVAANVRSASEATGYVEMS